jgi:DNA repair protein RecN (Recombination protein N)
MRRTDKTKSVFICVYLCSSVVRVIIFSTMITHLRITNFALLEDVALDLEGGLSFLTGETGAGKSILIDAICRLLGSRASQEDVRSGETKATIEAVFDHLSPQTLLLLREWEIDPDEGLILRREIHSSGRSRMMLNNCSVTLQQLRKLAPDLVDLFGQNEHQSLLDDASQRDLYDESIGIQPQIRQLASIAREIHALQNEWRLLREREQQRQRDIDIWKYQIKEIEEANPSETEEAELQSKRTLLQNRERLHSLSESLLQILLEKDDSFLSQLKELEKGTRDLAKFQEDFLEFSSRLEEWQSGSQELIQKIDGLRRGLEFEEGALDDIETRLQTLYRLKKKYGPTIQDVLNHLATAKMQLQSELNAEEREEELIRKTREAVMRYRAMAQEISRARFDAKNDFASRVEQELRQIAMEKCRFRVDLETGAVNDNEMEAVYSLHGTEDVRFEIEPNEGEGFRDLSRIASGGELSRLMLALKVVSQTKMDDHTFIFDEIDAGIGGRVAYQVGERLRRLSRSAQVLCVTHLPQVAAFGDHHYQVQKTVKASRTITVVNVLDEHRRVEELARMISGSEITETALRHARELREQVETGIS